MENPIIHFGPEYNEKRIFCRLSVAAELTYRLPGDNKTYRGECTNLSHSGIQFITEKGLEEGTSLEITIDTKSKKFKPMNALVKIIRVEALGENEFKVAAKIAEYK
jgi:c-di-GMP-binding flagellar brake protein YcgR